ncbi:MAG: immunoglobulin-like domain-containing protein, partial [Arcobacter sp.]|uniref:immunoglobulin-like domain-containing protein n=1 Tax=Arcobacter sp. TaxID=1872629 RepID=UPI003C795209
FADDYEQGTNAQDIVVTATDSANNKTDINVNLNETDVNEAPVFAQVSLSATDTNEAAGTVTFTATLSYKAGSDVTVHTTLGDILIKEGETTGKLEVTNPNTEDVYKDASTLDNAITSVEGGDFGKITPNTNTVTADIDDTITPIDITIDAVATAPKIIDVTTVNQDGTGVTATAYNRDGNETDVYIKNDPAGLGVKGTAWYTNEDSELGHDEKIVFDFTNDVNSLDVSFAWRNNQETAQMTFSNDGVQIGYATVSGGGSDVDAVVRYFDMNNNLLKEVPAQGGTDRIDLAYTFEFPDANGKPMAFDNVEFSAPNEQDDYLIHEISYTEVIDPEVTNISTTDGKITFNIQIDEDYPPQGKATAIVEVNGQEYEVDLNATGRGTLTLDAKDFPDLSNVDIQVKEIIGGNYEKVNTASESFDLSDSFKDDFKSTDDVININEDQTYVLTETDFGDIGTGVKEFKVTEIPSEGTLYLTVHKGETVIDANGNSHVITHDTQIEVNSGQVISLANVAAGNLVYVPKEDSDEDVNFKFQIGDGNGNFKDVDYTTDINIKAVADAPNASINVTKIESTSGDHNQGGNGSGNSNSDSLDVLQALHEGTGKDGNLDSNLNYSGTNDIVKDYQNVNASSITTDKGNDTLEFQSLNNGKNINTGDGDDKVVVNQSSSANIQLGEGDNTYTVAGSLNQGSTQAGSGDDTFIVNQGTNETTVNLGDGDNTISIGESLNRSNVSTGSGNDTLIVGNNSDANTISTGAGDDIVQFNGNVQDTKVDLGDGNDTINLSSDSDVNFNINTVIDGGKGQDTLHFSGKMEDYKVSIGIDGGESKLISWEEYAQMNKDPEGYKNKEFTIYEIDGNGTLQGSKFVVKNIENVVFESDKDSGTIETTEEYNVDFNAALNDVDGSESLTVTITNVPEGAEFTSSNSSYTLTNNNDGTWTVNLPDGTKDISDSIKMTVPKGTENIDLGITARATETNDNEDGTNYKESTDSDALVYSEDESKTLDFGQVNVNLAITIDISNSMADDNKLALAKQSIINMINNYDGAGNVKVLLTTFGDYGNTLSSNGDVWLDANVAINLINNLHADGGTNYDDALLKVIDSLKDNPAPLSGETISYFVSDGKPTYGMSEYNGTYYRHGNGHDTYSVNDDIAAQWKDLGFDKAYSIGMGDNSITTYLEEISNSDNDVIIVNNANDLDVTLQNTVESTIHGDVTDNITGGDGEKTINSIVVDGVTHTVSEATDNVLSLSTSAGGTLNFNFETGKYSYSGTNKDVVEDKESFTVNASDEDGDTTSFDVNINITNTIDNVASAPSLYFRIEDNGSQEIENNYNYEKWDSSLYGESYTNSNDYVNIKNDVKGWLGTFDGDDVVNVGDDVILNGNIDLGKGDDFITIKDKVGSYLDWVKIDGGEGNDSIYLKGYTINDYYKNEDNIQNKISNFENIKFKDGTVWGDASVFNTSPLSTTVYNYTITLAALLSDVDGSESLSKVTLDNIPDTITSVKDSSGNVYEVSGGTVQLPIEDAKEEEFTFVSTKHLESSEVNSMTASVTSTESENDAQSTVTTSAKISIEGDEHANTITGTDANEHIDGKGGADIIDAGAGDDTIVFNGTEKSIDGGTGNDTLIMNNDTIDLEDILKHTEIKNIENIDLTNNHAQEMNINLDDILDITDENHELKIFGDSDDKVTFDDKSNWTNQGTETIDGETFNVYQGTVGTSNVKVLIDDDVSVTPDV